MRKFNKENFEKIKLIAVVLFCVLVGSGSAKNFFDTHSSSDEITLSYQESLTTTEEAKVYAEAEVSPSVDVEAQNTPASTNKYQLSRYSNITDVNRDRSSKSRKYHSLQK